MRRKASGNSLNSLKLKNRRDVLTVVRRTSPVSIADIAAKTSLSKVTVTKILDHYVREGLVMDVGKASSNDERGKPPTFFALNPKYGFYFVVKIDGYNMLATLTDLHGRIFASHTTLYDQRIDLQALIHCIADAFTMLVDRENLTVDKCLAAIAGLHGIIEPESGVCFLSPQFPQWGHDIPMRTMLERNLPGVPVLVDNWVHFYGRGEAAAMVEPLSRFIVITSEIEGLNGALMVDGKLYRGHDSLAGEVGHMIVDSSDAAEVCMCGGKGCFEAVVSPRRLAARVQAKLDTSPEMRLAYGGDAPVSFQAIADAADAGDEMAREALRESARFFAIGIRNLMQSFDPELVLIQGEYAGAGRFFLEELRSRIPQTSLLGLGKCPRVEYSKLGPYGAIVGAANYAADIFFENA